MIYSCSNTLCKYKLWGVNDGLKKYNNICGKHKLGC